jgi:dihydroneopterin aldolase
VSEVTVELRGLELFGYHGATEEERRDGQRFLFDVELLLETRATETDALAHTLDYRDAAALVREISDRRPYVLLEALAAACAEGLLQRFPVIQVARVRIRKPDVVLDDPVEFSAALVERAR